MTLAPTETIVAINRVLAQIFVHPEHPDQISFLKTKLMEAGFARDDIEQLRLKPLHPSSIQRRPKLPDPDLSSDQILKMARRSLRPWRQILLAVIAKAESIADTHGGPLGLAVVLDNREIRERILNDLGRVIAEIVEGMRLRRIDTPEQAILCHLSAYRCHNDWCLNWESMTDAKLDRIDELISQSPALSVLRPAKTPALLMPPLAS